MNFNSFSVPFPIPPYPNSIVLHGWTIWKIENIPISKVIKLFAFPNLNPKEKFVFNISVASVAMDKNKRFIILEIHPYKAIDTNIYCEVKTAGMVCKGTQKAIHEALERQIKMLSVKFLQTNTNTGENSVEKST